jgi:hypothetical protein
MEIFFWLKTGKIDIRPNWLSKKKLYKIWDHSGPNILKYWLFFRNSQKAVE